MRKKFCMMRVVRPWPRLPKEVVNAPSLAVFKVRLTGALSNLLQWKAICTQLNSTHLQCFVSSPFWKLQDLLWEILSELQQARTGPEDSLSPS